MALIRQARLKTPRGVALTRTTSSAAFERRVEAAVRHTQRRFGVSRSLVIAAACGAFFGIDEAEVTGRSPVLTAKGGEQWRKRS